MSNARVIESCLAIHAVVSQKINRGKSSIHFRKNFHCAATLPICELFQLKKLPAKTKHLGLPLLIPRSRNGALEDMQMNLLVKLKDIKLNYFRKL